MQVKAIKIDHTAGGLLRHRFMRALAGGVLVLAAFGALIFAAVFGAAFVVLYFNEITGYKYTVADLGAAGAAAAVGLGILWALVHWVRPKVGGYFSKLRDALAARRWREAWFRIFVIVIGMMMLIGLMAAMVEGILLAGGFALLAAVVLGIVILIFALIVFLVAAAGALLQGFWFRLLPLLGLVSFGLTTAFGGILVIAAFVSNSPPELIAVLVVSGLGIFIVGLELIGQTLWQLFANNRGFFAARGWRPPIYRLLTITRRHMGLPGFLANVPKARARLTLLYLGVALANALSVVALISPAVISFFMAFMETTETGNPTSPPVTTTITVWAVSWVVAFIFYRVARWLSGLADKQVIAIYQGVREWDTRPPIVFLRSFSQDDDKLPAKSIDPFLTRLAGVAKPQTMDELLLEHASPYGPVIAIGDPRTTTPPLGAARIFVRSQGNEWQGVVTDLVQASSAVIMCPTTTEGVRWELQLVEQGDFRSRTIYLANPEISPEDSRRLFEQMTPEGSTLVMHKKKTPIAAFHCSQRGWTVLCANRRSLQTYTVALNYALQSVLGHKGAPLAHPKKKPKGKAAAAAATAPQGA